MADCSILSFREMRVSTRARGESHDESDVDLAVFLAREPREQGFLSTAWAMDDVAIEVLLETDIFRRYIWEDVWEHLEKIFQSPLAVQHRSRWYFVLSDPRSAKIALLIRSSHQSGGCSRSHTLLPTRQRGLISQCPMFIEQRASTAPQHCRPFLEDR